MIYQPVHSEQPLSQGDILDDCPLLSWETTDARKVAKRSQARPVVCLALAHQP